MNDPQTPPLPGAVLDEQSVTADWTVLQDLIDGVVLREVRHVLGEQGHTTEIFRRDWFEGEVEVGQVFQVTLNGGERSGWHVHEQTTDRLFVNAGQIKIALYDGRDGSPTFGRINVFRLGERRPGLVVVPRGVWHGLRNLTTGVASVLNLVDVPYSYEHPDHWRVPVDSSAIPHEL